MPRICTQGEAVYRVERKGSLEDPKDILPHVCAAFALVQDPFRGAIVDERGFGKGPLHDREVIGF